MSWALKIASLVRLHVHAVLSDVAGAVSHQPADGNAGTCASSASDSHMAGRIRKDVPWSGPPCLWPTPLSRRFARCNGVAPGSFCAVRIPRNIRSDPQIVAALDPRPSASRADISCDPKACHTPPRSKQFPLLFIRPAYRVSILSTTISSTRLYDR